MEDGGWAGKHAAGGTSVHACHGKAALQAWQLARVCGQARAAPPHLNFSPCMAVVSTVVRMR